MTNTDTTNVPTSSADILNLADKLEHTYGSDMFLGRLSWYAVPESARPDRNAFIDMLNANGLGDVNMPAEIRTVDIFKRACKQAEVSRHHSDGNPNVFNYLVRNSGTDVDHVWRTLVRETFDKDDHKLGYDEVAVFEYDRRNETMIAKWKLAPNDYERSLWNNVEAYFNSNAGVMTPLGLREFIRRTLERSLSAICVRPSGGVYFVGESEAVKLAGLETVINSIGCVFHSLPLLDDGKQREMLRKAFEDESVGDIDRLMDEVTEIMKADKKITQDRFIEMKGLADSLRQKNKQYSDLLDTALVESATRLEILSNQMMKLLKNNVKLEV